MQRTKWDPSQHPRGPVGRFITAGGGSGGWSPDPKLRESQGVLRDKSGSLRDPSEAVDKAYKGKRLFDGKSMTRTKRGQPDGLSYDEWTAAEEYAYASDVNARLRDDAPLNGHYNRQALALDRVVESNTLREDIAVYRGVSPSLVEGLQPGDQIRDRGFSSTSINPVISEMYGHNVLEIELPAGTHAAPISKVRTSEFGPNAEILIGRGAVFEIDNIRRTDRGSWISARLVGYVDD